MNDCFTMYDMNVTRQLYPTYLNVLEEFAGHRNVVEVLKMLGSMYATGSLGVNVDVVAAFLYYLEAAEKGDVECQFYVARFYFSAYQLLLTNSVDEAMKDTYDIFADLIKDPTMVKTGDDNYVYLDEKSKRRLAAAEQRREKIDYSKYPGLSKRIAMTKLKENTKLGIYYLEKAAEGGHSKAQMLMARYYMEGKDLESNFKKAFELMEKAAQNNEAGAYYNLGTVYYSGIKTSIQKEKLPDGCLSPEEKSKYYEIFEVEQDIDKAVECFKKSAELGDAVAIYWLGYSYIHGQHMEKDLQKGIKLVEQSCELGHPQAYYYMYLLYSQGEDVPKNEPLANQMFQAALRANSADAKFDLADRCLKGTHGERRDAKRALSLYEEAGSLGNGYALFCLGSMYYHGIGAPQDYKIAHKKYTQAVSCGVKEALVPLARMTIKGEGVQPADEKYGRYLLTLAKDSGIEFDESIIE